jgi:serine protease AprX
VVSGVVALLLSARPSLTPDQVKTLLTNTAIELPDADPLAAGAGMINLKDALKASRPRLVPNTRMGSGKGLLEKARGTAHVADDGVELSGERDIFGHTWRAAIWARNSGRGTAWRGGAWNGSAWTGDCFCDTTAARRSWSAVTWSGHTWSGRSWSGHTWSGRSWSGRSWSAGSWAGSAWLGRSWSGRAWSTARWGN